METFSQFAARRLLCKEPVVCTYQSGAPAWFQLTFRMLAKGNDVSTEEDRGLTLWAAVQALQVCRLINWRKTLQNREFFTTTSTVRTKLQITILLSLYVSLSYRSTKSYTCTDCPAKLSPTTHYSFACSHEYLEYSYIL